YHLAGQPRWAASDPTRDAFLVNVQDPAVVAVLSAEDLQLTMSVDIDAAGPHGLGIDCTTDTALVACDDATLVWLGLDDCRPRHRSPLAGGPDVVWVDATRRTAYVAVGDLGMLHVFHLDSREEITRIRTAPGAKTTALDEERGRLYVFLPEAGQAVVYSLGGGA
ncbi:MAG: YncE family protein, partial [Acidimicrobiales bacterium]